MKNQTVDPVEIEKFSRIADEWWNPRGKFKPLHDINPVRIGWIKDRIQVSGFRLQAEEKILTSPETQSPNPVTLLDIGCGGGLICEPFARMRVQVTGIDASEKNIAVAKLHAKKSGLDIDYRCMTAEELVANNQQPTTSNQFDVVLALEIVEHVADVPLFIKSCADLVKPGGIFIMSTISRTLKSYALAIVGAEYVLRWLPRGTHDWNKFLKPHELAAHLHKHNIRLDEMTGITLDPLVWKWKLNSKDLDVNYLLAGIKS